MVTSGKRKVPQVDRVTSTPITLRGRPRTAADGHDSLHIQPGGYLKYCWCMCSKCFLKYPSPNRQKDTHIGRCICVSCPCNSRI